MYRLELHLNSDAGVCILMESARAQPICQGACLGDYVLGNPGQPEQDPVISNFVSHFQHLDFTVLQIQKAMSLHRVWTFHQEDNHGSCQAHSLSEHPNNALLQIAVILSNDIVKLPHD